MGRDLATAEGEYLLEGEPEVRAVPRLAVAHVVRGEDQPLGIDEG